MVQPAQYRARAYRLDHQVGGQIRLEAPPDGGTRFVVTLPTGLAGSEGGDHDLRQQVQAKLAA